MLLTTPDYSSYYDDNGTFSPCGEFDIRTFSKGFLVTLYTLVFILGSLGNGLVVCVLVKHRNQTNLTDLCLLNLALSDLLFIFTLPFYIHYTVISEWTFGDFMCRFLSCSHYSGFFSSIFFMVIMTLDRYMVIMHAHKVARYRTMKVGVFMIAFVWMLSLCVSLPAFIFANVTVEDQGTGCYYSPENENWMHYDLFITNMLGLVIPMVVMVICYSRIIPTLVNMRTAKRHRIVRLIISIMVVFFVFWAPYNISRFLKFLYKKEFIEGSCTREGNIKLSTTVTEAIAYTHCCLNPIIYAFVGQKFMRRALQLLKKWAPDYSGSSSYWSSRKSSIGSRSSDVTSTVIM
ncbi:C-C chemokine receptor type 1 [Kryptolebias marmoratus]|uniref:Si:ch211-207g17.3 n=1 Tax=Kryptolebias marmoratus TaxID=37003 RepID=A0A3Q3BDJ2_KRYMA|nr:C-C chemokine receptor type 1 [Kryptolebias marmoratus]XP_024860319.1 C-C chemokine receptor type 1 [Kryptolebias marmoratus]